jgi:hypothetical protein
VSNSNSFSVSLTGVVFKTGGTITFDAGHSSCTATDGNPIVTLNVPTYDLPVSVAASSSVTFDLSNAVTMNATAGSSCQGATIYIPVTVTAHSS